MRYSIRLGQLDESHRVVFHVLRRRQTCHPDASDRRDEKPVDCVSRKGDFWREGGTRSTHIGVSINPTKTLKHNDDIFLLQACRIYHISTS